MSIQGDEDSLQRALHIVHENTDDYVALIFYATWCPFSRTFKPTFSLLASLFPSIPHFAIEESTVRPRFEPVTLSILLLTYIFIVDNSFVLISAFSQNMEFMASQLFSFLILHCASGIMAPELQILLSHSTSILLVRFPTRIFFGYRFIISQDKLVGNNK